MAWTRGGALTWGVEAIMLGAGTNVDWLVDDLQLLADPAESHDGRRPVRPTPATWCSCRPCSAWAPRSGTTEPAAPSSGSPEARRGPEIVRAVLEGVAQRGADLVEAAEADTGVAIPRLRVDGGMSANPTFVQALADASQRPVEVAPITEATTLGAGFLAGLAVGTWAGTDDLAAAWRPRRVVEPGRALDRARWQEAVSRARGWIPSLSALDF